MILIEIQIMVSIGNSRIKLRTVHILSFLLGGKGDKVMSTILSCRTWTAVFWGMEGEKGSQKRSKNGDVLYRRLPRLKQHFQLKH